MARVGARNASWRANQPGIGDGARTWSFSAAPRANANWPAGAAMVSFDCHVTTTISQPTPTT